LTVVFRHTERTCCISGRPRSGGEIKRRRQVLCK